MTTPNVNPWNRPSGKRPVSRTFSGRDFKRCPRAPVLAVNGGRLREGTILLGGEGFKVFFEVGHPPRKPQDGLGQLAEASPG